MRSLAIALAIGTLGASLFLVLPGFVGTLKQFYGFNDAQLGYLSSAHLVGLTAGTAAGAGLIARLGIRRATGLGLMVAALAYAVAVRVHSYHLLLALILLSGAGAGIAIAVCFCVLGQSRYVDRGFSYYNIAQLLFGAAALQWLPAISDRIGIEGMFGALAALFGISALISRGLPEITRTASESSPTSRAMVTAWIALGAIVIFFAGQSVVWAYLELIGHSHGLAHQSVATAVAMSSIAALAGPAIAVVVVSRWGRALPLAAGLGITLFALYLLRSSLTEPRFFAAACLFNLAWNFSSCYPAAIVRGADPSGRAMSWVAFATLAGVACGPFLGGMLIERSGLESSIWLGVALSLLSFAAFLPAIMSADTVANGVRSSAY